MQTTSLRTKTTITSLAAAVALFGLGAIQAQGQSVTYNFSDGLPDGWSNSGFGTSPAPTISNIGGVNYMFLPLGGFQVGNVATGDTSSALFQAMAAAAVNPAGYTISYNWYVDTSTFVGATFLQLGTFVNTGSGFYAQDYGANEVQLNGTQLASGGVFQGTVTVNMAAVGYTMPSAQTFFRLGLIENGNGTGVGAYFSNITIAPVSSAPEPSTMALVGVGLAAGAPFLRRRKA